MAEAARHNQGKPELSQLHHFRLSELAIHCSRGRQKYPDTEDGTPNWKIGGKPDQEYLDSAERHLAAIVQGEKVDPETGTYHAVAVAWNMLALTTNNYEPVDQYLAKQLQDRPVRDEPEWLKEQFNLMNEHDSGGLDGKILEANDEHGFKNDGKTLTSDGLQERTAEILSKVDRDTDVSDLDYLTNGSKVEKHDPLEPHGP